MAQLEIRRRSGAIETIALDRKSSVTIGASPAADVRIDAEGVLAIECRVSWNGQAFVVNTVNPEGVPLNGATIRKAELSDADRLRIGDVDLVFSSDPRSPAPNPSADLQLKSDSDSNRAAYSPPGGGPRNPLSGRSAAPSDSSSRGRAGGERSGRGGSARRPEDRPPRADYEADDEDDDQPIRVKLPGGASPMDEILADDSVSEKREKPVLARGGGTVPRSGPSETPLKERVKQLWRPAPRRPGEQELHRSPLVVGLSIGALVLLLTAGTLWFVLAREFMNRKYEAAQQALDAGQYLQAIDGFTKFVAEYPRTPEAKTARVNIGKAQVEQSLAGALPDWELGLKTLNEFVNDHRDTEEFQPGNSLLRTFARDSANRIALGAAETARVAKRRPLLAVSNDARILLDLLSPADDKPEEKLTQIQAALRTAEAAILQQETFDAALARMKESIDGGTPLAALQAYRQLLDRYAVARMDKSIQAQLKAALEADHKSVQRLTTSAPPVDPPPNPGWTAVSLTRRVRARTDVTSVGATTASIGEGALFGVDTITGDVLWRVPVGSDPPFPPVAVQSASNGWLAFDALRQRLICVRERTGELLWSAPLSDRPTGPPLIHEGQIFLATAGATLLQYDLQTGEPVASLRFSQPVIGPPAITPSGDRMYLAGRESTLYVLSRRPLACEQSVWLGQGAGSIRAPVLMLRDYLLLVENQGGNRSVVRLLDTSRDPKNPREIASSEIEGQVYDTPVVRGKQVVIPSSPERLTAFLIAETGDAQSLTRVASYQVPGAQPGPLHVLLGPDDQFWMSSTALRRFDIKVDSIVPDKQQVAVGLTTQPLVASAESLFLGRRNFYSRAVLLASADRQKMVLDWQSVLGAAVLDITDPAPADGSALAVSATGDVFQLNPSKLARSGFEMQPATILPVDEKSTVALGASRLSDGRVAVWSAGETPRLWIVSNESAPRETKLDLPLQSAPVRLAEGLVLPLPGRLRVAARTPNSPPVQEWTAPVQAGEGPVWKGIAAINETSLVALDSSGRLMLAQLRTNPKPNLAEVAHWEAGSPVDLPLAIAGERAIVTASNGRVSALDAESLEPVGQFDLVRPPSGRAVIIGTRVLVDAGRQSLVCLDSANRLQKIWELPLDGAALVGGVEHGGRLILARDDGLILMVDPATGEIRNQTALHEQLAFGPRVWADRLVVGTLDGTLLSQPLAAVELASGSVSP